MKDRVFKVVWVDSRGGLWSAMKGVRGFFRQKRLGDIMWNANRPLRYRVGKMIAAAPDMKPYLFAFASVPTAVDWVKYEFQAAIDNSKFLPFFVKRTGEPNKFNKGHLEIWEATGDIMTFPKKEQDMYDSFIMQNAPHGTLICRSLKLSGQVTSLV